MSKKNPNKNIKYFYYVHFALSYTYSILYILDIFFCKIWSRTVFFFVCLSNLLIYNLADSHYNS